MSLIAFKSLFITTIITLSLNLHARSGLAAKYSIPHLNDSHIVLGEASDRFLNPDSIKVLVWNILKAERRNWSRDFKQMSEQSDILLLQEGYLNNTMKKTFNELTDFRFDMGVSFLYNKDNYTPTGTIVGSRATPDYTGFLRTKNYEPFIKTPKTITYGVFPIEGHNKSLLVLSIHGMNFTRQSSFNRQVDEAVELIDQHDGPVIFAGDFNTHNKKRMRFLRQRMQSRKFTELTYRDDKRMHFLGNILDHAFTRGLLVRNSKVLKHVKSSDHKPMVLDLVLDR